MNIASLEAFAWNVPMRAPYRSARRVTTVAQNVLVIARLEDGNTGFGESAPAQYVTGETQETVLAAVAGWIERLVGRDTNDALDKLAAMPDRHTMPGAIAALETALADAAARAAGLPLYRFLTSHAANNAPTPPCLVTDLSLPILPPKEAGARAAQAAADGFRALKIKVGSGDGDADAARVRAVAGAAPKATLRLDGNQGFTPEEAVRFLDGLGDLAGRVTLLEQPTKAGDDDAIRFVARRVPCPVFADEAVQSPDDARRLLESGACAGVVLKLAKSGLSETSEIARIAGEAGGVCMFGCMMETRVATGAALHLALALGAVVAFLDLDGPMLVNDGDLVSGGFTQRGDMLCADPDAPGLGLSARAML